MKGDAVPYSSDDRSPPSEKEVERITESRQRWDARKPPVQVTLEGDDDAKLAKSLHSDDSGHLMRLGDAFGTRSCEFLASQIGVLDLGLRARGQSKVTAQQLNAGFAFIAAIAPENELEAALAVQMAQNHFLTTELLGRAAGAMNVDHVHAFGNLAVKMQRTFTAQIEALARLRGKGQQTVRVEHVTVEAGAQAIVGDVHHHAQPSAPRKESSHDDSPIVRRAALRSPDPLGTPMPGASDAERPLSYARRAEPRRARKYERAEARSVHARDEGHPPGSQ